MLLGLIAEPRGIKNKNIYEHIKVNMNIVRGESKDPRNRSRLSDIKEVSDVLANKKVRKNILTLLVIFIMSLIQFIYFVREVI